MQGADSCPIPSVSAGWAQTLLGFHKVRQSNLVTNLLPLSQVPVCSLGAELLPLHHPWSPAGREEAQGPAHTVTAWVQAPRATTGILLRSNPSPKARADPHGPSPGSSPYNLACASESRPDKVLQTGGLKQQKWILSGSQQLEIKVGIFLSGQREKLRHASLLASGNFWTSSVFLACGGSSLISDSLTCHPHMAFSHLWLSQSLCPNFPFLIRTPEIGFGPSLIHTLSMTSAKILFPEKFIFPGNRT